MGIKREQVTTYTCDRCGWTGDSPLGNGPGYSDVHWSETAMAYNGDIGGGSSDWWFCGRCTVSFHEWRTDGQRQS